MRENSPPPRSRRLHSRAQRMASRSAPASSAPSHSSSPTRVSKSRTAARWRAGGNCLARWCRTGACGRRAPIRRRSSPSAGRSTSTAAARRRQIQPLGDSRERVVDDHLLVHRAGVSHAVSRRRRTESDRDAGRGRPHGNTRVLLPDGGRGLGATRPPLGEDGRAARPEGEVTRYR